MTLSCQTSRRSRTQCTWVISFCMLFLAGGADALCADYGKNERLVSYCLLSTAAGKVVDANLVKAINSQLQRQGYASGLGVELGASEATATHSTNFNVTPLLTYSDNINGGNSPDNLVLGDLTFEGDKQFYRKEGMIGGLGIGGSGRFLYGGGRYLEYGMSASYARSPRHDIDVTTTSANACSINHVSNWWSIDLCADLTRTRRDLTETNVKNISLSTSKIFNDEFSRYSEVTVGFNRYLTNDYKQNQVLVSYDTIHPNAVFTSLGLTVGEQLEDQLATRFAITADITTLTALNKPLTISTGFSYADGGKILGFDRNERTYSINLSYPVWRKVNVFLGYRNTNSNIDYFDVKTPTFGVRLTPITF